MSSRAVAFIARVIDVGTGSGAAVKERAVANDRTMKERRIARELTARFIYWFFQRGFGLGTDCYYCSVMGCQSCLYERNDSRQHFLRHPKAPVGGPQFVGVGRIGSVLVLPTTVHPDAN